MSSRPDLIETPITPGEFAAIRRATVVRRRWMLAILATACLIVGFGAWRAGRHFFAAGWLRTNSFHVDWEINGENWKRGGATTVQARRDNFLASGSASGNDLAYLTDLHRVEGLDLALLDGLRDADLAVIERLTDLQVLHLDRSRYLSGLGADGLELTDLTLGHLRGLRRLRELSLARTRITDAGLSHLSGLADLESLDLDQTGITDAGLEPLKALRALKTLTLSGTRVSPAGVGAFEAAMPGVHVIFDPPSPVPR